MVVCTAVPLSGCSELGGYLPSGSVVSLRRVLCCAVSVLRYQSNSTRRDCDGALFCRRLRSHCREVDSRLCGRTHSCRRRGGSGQCNADLFRGDIRSDNEAEPGRSSFELCNFPASLAGLPPVDSAVRGCQQRRPLVSCHRWRRDGGSFLRGLQEVIKRTTTRVRRCECGKGGPASRPGMLADWCGSTRRNV